MISPHLIPMLTALAILALATKPQVNVELQIINSPVSPDGYPRVGVLPNMFPGPVISANKGDKFNITVINNLNGQTMPTDTSVHWHGLHVKKYIWADGAAFVGQCPITSGHAFTYTFDGGDQVGTFWYHSHLTSQYCDGLWGPLIIYDPDDPHQGLYDVDNASTIITLADWYHKPFSGDLTSNSTLINGLGRYKGGPPSPLAIVDVEQGKRYRFRFISMSCDPNFNVSIDGHELTIIEADGVNTKPLIVDSFQIFAGQRYSAILHANNQVGNYWIRVNTSQGPSGFDGGINSAVLRYHRALEEEPAPSEPKPLKMMLREWDLHPLKNAQIPGKLHTDGADMNINLEVTTDPNTKLFLMNGHPYIPPVVPVLLQILQILHGPPSNIPKLLPKETIYYVPLNKTIQLSMPIPKTLTGDPHPMHLHGHNFTVIRSAGNSSFQWENPIQRDTVDTGYVGDNVTIRWTTDNPGPWLFHCHIDDHFGRGMALIFVPEDLQSVEKDNTPVPGQSVCFSAGSGADSVSTFLDEWKMLCPNYKDQFLLGNEQDSIMMH